MSSDAEASPQVTRAALVRDVLVRTRPASPSTLGLLEVCPLAYLMQTETVPRKRVGQHPAALLGKAIHSAANSMMASGISAPHTVIELVKNSFSMQVADPARSSTLGRWMLDRYGVDGFVSRRQLVEHSAYAIGLAKRLPQRSPSHNATQGMEGRVPIGSERWLESKKSGVAGRVDLILRGSKNTFRIADFKTGKVFEEDGRVKRGYLLQMAAYARIVEDIDPASNIELELLGRTEAWSSPFDEGLRSMIDSTLASLQTKLPLGEEVLQEHVAFIGEHCSCCAARPSCGAYNAEVWGRVAALPGSWTSGALDVCGRVLEVCVESGLASLRFEDASGARARIVGIPSTIVEEAELVVGSTFIAYALGTSEPVREGCFPSNFFVVDPISPRRTAFQAVFTAEKSTSC